MSIDKLLSELSEVGNTQTLHNPYRHPYARANLRHYLDFALQQPGKRILLVGEAPGYKGCAITGIPFTSGRVFQNISHPWLLALKDKITLPKIEAESTATIVWEYLATKPITPLFWNAFPFHPHKPRQPNSNRPPSSAEIECGVKFLSLIASLYKPDLVAAIGKKAISGLDLAFPDEEFRRIRHPARGGKKDFVTGINDII